MKNKYLPSGDYIRQVRLQKALALLPEKKLPLTTIAFQCGFADQSHFIRTFKTAYAITPLKYRQLFAKSQR